MSIVTAVVAGALASFDRLLWRPPSFHDPWRPQLARDLDWGDSFQVQGFGYGCGYSTYQDRRRDHSDVHLDPRAAVHSRVHLYLACGGLVPEPDGLLRLWYTFRNEPRLSIQERSRVNHGGAQLALGDKDEVLEGAYWTDRDTSGEITVRYTGWKRAKDFASGLAIEAKEKPVEPAASNLPKA